jgi:deaminated glutathione amidase
MSRRVLDVAVVQLSSGERIAENLEVVARLVGEAAGRGAKLVVLPENFAFMGRDEDRRAHAEPLGDTSAPIQRLLSKLAKEHAVTLVGGGMPERHENADVPFNTAVVFDERGTLVSSYRKIHLFDVDLTDGTVLKESACTAPGVAPVVVKTGGFGVGLSICYDLRFPELYRRLVDEGAELLLVPAAFTLHTGKDHWHVLLRARAIEAQCYVAAAAQWGKHPLGRATYGHSLVVDPWGTVVAECSDGIGYALARIEAKKLEEVRSSLPSLKHRIFKS